MRKLIACFVLLLFMTTASAQKNSAYKFQKITAEDLKRKHYTVDSQAHAVYIADVGSSQINGNMKGGFTIEFRRRARVHILNKNGNDEANVTIPLFTAGSSTEKLSDLKATTYNLENGEIKESKLQKEGIFTDKYSKNLILKKFTFPHVREGSIVDFEYTIESDFISNLQPWTFQGESPRLWSEYNVALPEFLHYVFLSQGYVAYHLNDQKDRQEKFTIMDGSGIYNEKYDFNAKVTDYKWVMKDVPGLKEENFTSSIKNYVAKIEFQLAALRKPLTYRTMMSTWPELSQELLSSEDFGSTLNSGNSYLDETLESLLAGASTETEKALRIYQYVRDNFTTQGAGIYLSETLRNTFKTKKGNVASINLLLIAMLRSAKIHAEPVILSTREHGYTSPLYPVLSKFNYLVTRVNVDGKYLLLDATESRLGFGRLLPECYNGHARIVNEEATAIDLMADSVKERKVTAVMLNAAADGKWLGTVNQLQGYYESYKTRNQVREKGEEEFFKQVKKDFGLDVTLQNPRIDSLNQYEEPVAVRYAFSLDMNNEDIIYLNPVFGEGYHENPFKSAERLYPVEMPFTSDETYVATINIPEGYVVDELPKSMKVKLNEEEEGIFEYLVSHSGNTISMRTRVVLRKAFFSPEEYGLLREFFNMIVAKQKEQIVLKKKK